MTGYGRPKCGRNQNDRKTSLIPVSPPVARLLLSGEGKTVRSLFQHKLVLPPASSTSGFKSNTSLSVHLLHCIWK
uniref:Uncharacterized protein n=1 Tax=Pararge aegeria TaxID=116150 RepID=S4P0X1_9NEOP